MQAVITGATSFIGKKLSETLRAHGWDVVHVVRRPQENAENIEEVLLDMENYDRLGDKIGSCGHNARTRNISLHFKFLSKGMRLNNFPFIS